MIYDCFTFFNELDLLEIRLNVLNDVVDKFVIVEGDKTHTGADKDFIFEQNKSRYKKFLNKIIYIKVDDFPSLDDDKQDRDGNKWIFENFQRDAIMRGLSDCKDDDVVIISDLDEIPNPEKIIEYAQTDGIKCFDMPVYYYYLNCFSLSERINTLRMLKYKDLLNGLDNHPLAEYLHFRIIEQYRDTTNPNTIRCFNDGVIIKNGGWHFSYLGGVEAIIKKRQSIVEQQFNTKENMSADVILRNIKSGKDILGRKELKYEIVKLDSTFPKYILENQEKYSHLICQASEWYFIKQKLHKNIKQKILKPALKLLSCLLPVKKWRKKLRAYAE